MSFAMFMYLMRLMAMEKKLDLVHDEKIYNACKNWIMLNPERVTNYFIGCVSFDKEKALDIEELLDYFWKY